MIKNPLVSYLLNEHEIQTRKFIKHSPAEKIAKQKLLIVYFLCGWFLLNLLSAIYTELSYDESYYWMYSRFPDWGYYDHPPFIAFMHLVGYMILPDEAGVRLLTLVSSCITLLLLYHLSEKPDVKHFAMLIFSSLPFHLFGFISLPDVPLLLFSTLFFFLYKKHLESGKYGTMIALAITMAALMYSKYHGIFVILLTILSNLRLLTDKKFLLATVLSLLLYLPHLYWQYTHDFISLQFHFSDRFQYEYTPVYTMEYFLLQPVFYGPLAGFLMIVLAFRSKPENLFERAMYFSLWGIFIIFFLATFKGRVEGNWTLPALIPMTYFTFKYLRKFPSTLRWLELSFYISIPLFILTRILLTFPSMIPLHRMGEISGWKSYAQIINTKAVSLPVIANTYQDASKLSFYTGRIIPSLNLNGRHNQFDLWGLSSEYDGKDVLLLNNHIGQGERIFNPKSDQQYLTPVKSIRIFQGVALKAQQSVIHGNAGENVSVNLSFYSINNHRITLPDSLTLKCLLIREDQTTVIRKIHVRIFTQQGRWFTNAIVRLPQKKGKYKMRFSVYSDELGDWGSWTTSGLIVK